MKKGETSMFLANVEESKICKVCFKEIKDKTFYNFVNKNPCICDDCMSKISSKFNYFKVDGYSAMSIFDYDSELRKLVYQFKGCFDIELSRVFLERYAKEIGFMYFGYVIVPAPSFQEENEKREFNHVIEIFSRLKLRICQCILKTSPFKQAERNSENRSEISKHLELVGGKELKGKRVLIVDDVFTTGSTVKAMIRLLEPLKPRTIKVLVISKTTLKPLDT